MMDSLNDGSVTQIKEIVAKSYSLIKTASRYELEQLNF